MPYLYFNARQYKIVNDVHVYVLLSARLKNATYTQLFFLSQQVLSLHKDVGNFHTTLLVSSFYFKVHFGMHIGYHSHICVCAGM